MHHVPQELFERRLNDTPVWRRLRVVDQAHGIGLQPRRPHLPPIYAPRYLRPSGGETETVIQASGSEDLVNSSRVIRRGVRVGRKERDWKSRRRSLNVSWVRIPPSPLLLARTLRSAGSEFKSCAYLVGSVKTCAPLYRPQRRRKEKGMITVTEEAKDL